MARNIINPEEIDSFLRLLAEDQGDPHVYNKLGDYLILALHKVIREEATFFKPLDRYPDNPPEWLTREKFENGRFEAFHPTLTQGSMDTLKHITDWIKGALVEQDAWIQNVDSQGRPKQLLHIKSLAEAHVLADRVMREKAARLKKEFAKQATGFEEIEKQGHIKTIKILENGNRIVQLLTPKALDLESAQLGHCIGNGAYDNQVRNTGRYQYYSLRDKNNQAHATLEVDDGYLMQCSGKENNPPVGKYIAPLKDFILEHQWTLKVSEKYSGLLRQDGEYYDVNNLPENFHYRDDIDLNNAIWFRGFPKGFKADGSVFLECCTSLTHLPDGFHAGGDVYLNGCTSLTHLLNGFHAGGDVDLDGCINLTHLPDGFYAGGYVDLDGCESLKYLPDDMHVGGAVYWNNKEFKSIEDFRVAFEEEFPPEIYNPHYQDGDDNTKQADDSPTRSPSPIPSPMPRP